MPTPHVDVSAAPSEVLLVERFLAALESLNEAEILDLVDESIVYQNVPLPPARGREAFEKQMNGFAKYMTEFKVDSAEYSAHGATVYCNRYDTLAGPGFSVRLWVEGEFVTSGDRIVRWTDRFSWPVLLAKLALTVPGLALHLAKKLRSA